MEDMESQIAEWRSYMAKSPAVDDHDVEELESHLRDQVDGLRATGLSGDEAFLVAMKRMGDLDAISREFAREHSRRLWKQLVLQDNEAPTPRLGGSFEAVSFAIVAAVAVQSMRLFSNFPEDADTWLMRNAGLIVLPFLAAYFARRRRLDVRRWVLSAVPFVLGGLAINLYPWEADSATALLAALHLPVALWFAIAFPYMGGTAGLHERRMDFVRFTGEWVIYYVLIGLGGGVLMGLTSAILEPIQTGLSEKVIEWVLPSGVAGAMIIAAWLVESKQRVVENMAPVLTMLFTPLFALMLAVAAVTYAVTGVLGEFDRELLGVFDAMLVVVLGLVLYAMSARDESQPVGMMDRVQLVAVISALVLDGMVLTAMIARVGDLGFTPNRVAALGLNLILLVNLAGTAWLSMRFLQGRTPFHRIERWQTSYLPVFAIWAAAVVTVVPLLFGFA